MCSLRILPVSFRTPGSNGPAAGKHDDCGGAEKRRHALLARSEQRNLNLPGIRALHSLEAAGAGGRGAAARHERHMDELSDTELMALVKEGDYRAFDVLYDRYRGPIVRFLFSLTWDAQAAEDGLQEVFLGLFRARADYTPTAKLGPIRSRASAQMRGSSRRSD
jgi:hypothetical protein